MPNSLYICKFQIKSFWKAWLKTSRQSQWLRQSWPQGRGRRSRRSWRWSRARSSSGISRTLWQNIIRAYFQEPEKMDWWKLIFTKYGWASKVNIHQCDVLLICVVQVLFLNKNMSFILHRIKTLVREEISSFPVISPGNFGLIGPGMPLT